MVAPLIALAIGLAKQKEEDDENERQRGYAAAEIPIDLMYERAARAGGPGNSSYMRHAMGAAENLPRTSSDSRGLLSLGAALFDQSAADRAVEEANITHAGPKDDGSIGGGTFQQGNQPTFDEDTWDDPNRRAGGLIGGMYNRSRGGW